MQTKKVLQQDIQELTDLGSLVSIYGQIASIRMRKIRDYVLKNREFLDSINQIFAEVVASYSAKVNQDITQGKKSKLGNITFLSHNGKSVAVFISSNTGLFGEVVQKTFRLFLEEVRRDDLEVTIVGRRGLSLFQESEPTRPYTFFELSDFNMEQSNLTQIIKHLVQYEEIRVYFGKYKSVVTQDAVVNKISAGTPLLPTVKGELVKYIFEPSIEKILEFFETEIFASVFDQSLRESQLAKYASRIMAMDDVGKNINDNLSELRQTNTKLIHSQENSKQLNSMSSMIYGSG